MDIALSLAAGLGLRAYLIRVTAPGSFIGPAVVGLWEGVLVHQLSLHPPSTASSSAVDHYLALGLRLVVDFLIARTWARVALVGVWTAIGAVASESAFPGILNRTAIALAPSDNGHRGREKRHRHSQSTPSHVTSHVRVYQVPGTPPALPVPPPRTITPTHPSIKISVEGLDGQVISSPRFPPPSPPSFFLQADSEPSPFPDSAVSPIPILAQIPARPHSSLSFYPEGVKGTSPEDNDTPPSPPLPTPPDSTIRERTLDSRVDRLSTIDEITSRSEHVDNDDVEQKDVEGEDQYVSVSHGDPPLPVPNPTSHYIRMEDYALAAPDDPPRPIPPVDWQPGTPNDDDDELRTPGQPVHDVSPDSDEDELRTPPGRQSHTSNQNGTIAPPMSVPEGAENNVPRVEKALSPLLFDSQSLIHESTMITSTILSNYPILQRPVPPTPLGPLLIPVPPIPSTSTPPVGPNPEAETQIDAVLSPLSDAETVLSTRIPFKLLERGDNFRNQANEEDKEINRLQNELRMATIERRPRDALFLRGDLQDAKERRSKFHAKASRRYLEGHNNMQKPNTLDVHRLKPAEALEATEAKLRDVLRHGQGVLKVIVGKGKHSKDGIPVVKNHLIAEMHKRSIPCKIDPLNSGILILSLPPLANGTAHHETKS